MIKTYSLSKDGDKQLAKNFKLKEFRCKDGSDKVLVDELLPTALQIYRDTINMPINILSAYRTESYNESCGGAKNSYHVLGSANDIYCKGKRALDIAKWFEANGEKLGIRGIGLYINRAIEFVHIDTRKTKYYWINENGVNRKVDSF